MPGTGFRFGRHFLDIETGALRRDGVRRAAADAAGATADSPGGARGLHRHARGDSRASLGRYRRRLRPGHQLLHSSCPRRPGGRRRACPTIPRRGYRIPGSAVQSVDAVTAARQWRANGRRDLAAVALEWRGACARRRRGGCGRARVWICSRFAESWRSRDSAAVRLEPPLLPRTLPVPAVLRENSAELITPHGTGVGGLPSSQACITCATPSGPLIQRPAMTLLAVAMLAVARVQHRIGEPPERAARPALSVPGHRRARPRPRPPSARRRPSAASDCIGRLCRPSARSAGVQRDDGLPSRGGRRRRTRRARSRAGRGGRCKLLRPARRPHLARTRIRRARRENRPGTDAVVLFSRRFWQAHFGADPNIIGRELSVNGRTTTVVGIVPDEQAYPAGINAWVPLVLSAEEREERTIQRVTGIGRIMAGASSTVAAADLARVAGNLALRHPDTNRGRGFDLQLLRRERFEFTSRRCSCCFRRRRRWCCSSASPTWRTCSSLARSAASELHPGRAWWAAAVMCSRWSWRKRSWPRLGGDARGAGRLLADRPDPRSPARRHREVDRRLEHDRRGWADDDRGRSDHGRDRRRARGHDRPARDERWLAASSPLGAGRAIVRSTGWLRRLLVAGQVAIAVLLLVTAAVTLQGFRRLAAAFEELRPASLAIFTVALPAWRYPDDARSSSSTNRLLAGLRESTEVESAGLIRNAPASNVPSPATLFTVVGRAVTSPSDAPSADLQTVTGDTLRTLAVDMVAGRPLSSRDGPEAPRAAVISRAMARRIWPGADPRTAVGASIRLGLDPAASVITVVGVVADVRLNWYDPEPRSVIYLPDAQAPLARRRW